VPQASAETIPEAPEAEEAVLGAILYNGRILDELALQLTPADFYSSRRQAIYAASIMLHIEGSPVNLVTVTNRLREMGQLEPAGGPMYITHLMDGVFGDGLSVHYARIVRERSQQRRALRAVTDAAIVLRQPTDKWATDVENLQQQLFVLMQADHRSSLAPMGEIVPQEYDRLQDLWRRRQLGEPVPTGVPTGFQKLDKILGGFHAGDLVIVAGRPAQGKTTFLSDLALRHAVTDQKVAFFSLEMSRQAILTKWISALSKVPLQHIRQGDFRLDEPLRVADACDRLSVLPILLDDDPSLTISDFRARVRQAVNAGGPHVVLVDYLQRVHALSAVGRNRQEEVAEIAAGLKTVAREMNVPVLAAAQLSRNIEQRGEEARPRLSDLRESGRIEAEADVVMFLHREPANPGRVKLLIAKHRMGPEDEVNLQWHREIGRFDEVA